MTRGGKLLLFGCGCSWLIVNWKWIWEYQSWHSMQKCQQ